MPEAPEAAQAWSESTAAVLASQDVSLERGLSLEQVGTRLAKFGRNQLHEPPAVPRFMILLEQFRTVVVALLVVASVLSLAVGDVLEASAIATAIFLTVATGFFTELRAVRSMEALRRLGSVQARVRRAGVDQMVSAEALVPGDVVLIEGGDMVTADLRIAEASKLQANESSLTGESVPVGKDSEKLPTATPLAERRNMLYKGTTITRGSGTGIVVGTGTHSELGRIADLVSSAEDQTTPLEDRLAALGRRLVWVCLAIAALTVVVGIARGRAIMLMLETGVALAVAAIPEGLPIVATIALARGMWRLAARNALVKRLSAVETLGATSVIVTDKTGTLTENRMQVVAIDIDSRRYALGRAIELDSAPVVLAQSPGLQAALEVGALCNNASIAGEHVTGDPLEVALLRAAELGELTRETLLKRYPEEREDAFDTELRMMATVHSTSDGFRAAVKGAPEPVLDASEQRWTAEGAVPMNAEAKREILACSEDMAQTGLRILAVAQRSLDRADAEVYQSLTFLGLIGLADPPRDDVREPLAACRRAGIRVIMATGDQPATASSIARAVGLLQKDQPATVVRGDELGDLASLSTERRDELLRTQVFARVTPEQKLDIIGMHQDSGAIVAMTGDGVNDAPALRKAEIGIAMGLRGTDVARDAAEMVLKDDSFESIVLAVEQGRAIFENIRRFVIYLLSCNLSEVMIVTLAVALNAPLPLLPLQILFLNLVTDVFPALALGFGRGDPGAMQEPPRTALEPIVRRRDWITIARHAAVMTAAVLSAMGLATYQGASTQETTTVSFLTLALAQLWHVFNMRGAGSHLLRNDVVGSPWVRAAILLCVGLIAAAAFFSPLALVLGVARLGASQWGLVLAMSLVPLVAGQPFLGHNRSA